MRGAHSLITCRGAKGCDKICRILRNTVSPVLKVNPGSVQLGRLVIHLRGSISRIVVTAGSDLRNRAATVCVDGLVGPAKVGIAQVTDKIPINKSLRCVSRMALLHTLRKEARLWVCDCSYIWEEGKRVVGRLRLRGLTGRVHGDVMATIRDTGSNRPNKSLSSTSVFACLCFRRVGVSPGGPGVRSHSHFMLSGKRMTPTCCSALTRHKFFPGRSLIALHRANSCLRKRPSVGRVPNISVSDKSLKRKISTTMNVTTTKGFSRGSCHMCALAKSNRVRRKRV